MNTKKIIGYVALAVAAVCIVVTILMANGVFFREPLVSQFFGPILDKNGNQMYVKYNGEKDIPKFIVLGVVALAGLATFLVTVMRSKPKAD